MLEPSASITQTPYCEKSSESRSTTIECPLGENIGPKYSLSLGFTTFVRPDPSGEIVEMPFGWSGQQCVRMMSIEPSGDQSGSAAPSPALVMRVMFEPSASITYTAPSTPRRPKPANAICDPSGE